MQTKARLKRKLDHIENAIIQSDGPSIPGFKDIYLVHQALPGVNWNDIDSTQNLWGKKLSFPLIINAITGGPLEAKEINKKLALLAAEHNIGMAVGSQTIALQISSAAETFKVARKVNPNGLLIANIGANIGFRKAIEVVEMIEADALQVHINTAQEIFMDEGDRDFAQLENNIAEIIFNSPVPVIVKEVGFGISKECASKLYQKGVRWIDVSGTGGTNFIKIETARSKENKYTSLTNWGIPTVSSVLEIKQSQLPVKLIASGGLRNGDHLLKAISIGAIAGAIAGPFIKSIMQLGNEELNNFIES